MGEKNNIPNQEIGIYLHPRHEKNQLALCETQKLLLNIIEKYDLRFSEILNILNNLSANWIKYLQQEENKHYKKRDEKNEK